MMGTKILWRPHPRFRRDDDADGNGDDDDYDEAPSNDNEMARGGGGAPPSENDHRRGGRAEDDDDNGGGAQDRHHLPTTMELMDRSLVVGQEVSLAAMLLAVHGEIVNREEEEGGGSGGGRRGHGGGGRGGLGEILGLCPPSSAAAAAIVYSSLLVIIYFNLQSQSPTSSSSSSLSSLGGHHRPRRRRPPPGRRRVAAVRLSDGALLAALLRLLSGALRSLTASYSADTVYALAVCGMSIHLLGCDYAYANGVGGAIVNDVDDDGGVARAFVGAPSPPSSGGDGAPTSASASTSASGGEDADRHPRPPFLGGTVSLNAAFFSTVLLSSRVRSDVASYAFVSSVVTLFAFYPASRHNIAGRYPNSILCSPCSIVTIALTAAAWLLLPSTFERCLFAAIQSMVLVVSPLLRYRLQTRKRTISGPWDIAHV